MTTMASIAPPVLRPYQVEAVEATLSDFAGGRLRRLGVASTGLGKTLVFAEVARRLNVPTLILAHRDELISQAVEKLAWAWPDARVGVVQSQRNDWGAPVVVASVQTLARTSRLRQVPQRFELVIVDEAHHSAADSYRRVLDHLAPPGTCLLGVTATPDRGDGKGLAEVYAGVSWSYDILWGIANGFLADLRGVRVGIDVDLGDVAVRRGDYADGALGAALEAADAPTQVATAWRRHAMGRRGLVFCPTIHLANETAAQLRAIGVNAGSVSGVDLAERRRLLADLHTGRLDVVANCSILVEGFDEPRVDCVVIARPTRSRPLYTQMIGRGVRRHPDKTDCLVLDVVGATGVHELVTVTSLFGLEAHEMGTDGQTTVGEAVGAKAEREAAAGRLVATEVDLFRRLRAQRIPWVAAMGRYAAGAGERVVVLERHGDGEVWSARALSRGKPPLSLVEATTLERAQGVAEGYVRDNRPAVLTNPNASWRKGKPSPKALGAAAKWRIAVDADWTAGQVSDALDQRVAEARIREMLRRGA